MTDSSKPDMQALEDGVIRTFSCVLDVEKYRIVRTTTHSSKISVNQPHVMKIFDTAGDI